jgi:molybdate transport system substrate-binding protein
MAAREDIMKICRTLAVIAAVALPFLAVQAQAAELKVFASTAVKAVLEELGPQFEKSTGNKLVFTFDPAAKLKTQIDQGAAVDVAVLTASLNDALATAGKLDPASRMTVARAGLGVAVRAGAPKPDVSTAAALKQTLLNAKSIGYNGVGASRAGTEAMLAKLGIADQVKSKVKLLDVSAPIAVAKGDVEIGLGPVSEVLPVAGAQLAGPYPADVQAYLVFTAGVASASKDADAAKALIQFLAGPAAAPVLKAKGMEPG